MKRHAKAPFAGPTARRRMVGLLTAAALVCLALGATVASAVAPTVTIEDASDVGYTTAKVKGTVDRSEQSTTYRFQYVTQASFEAEGFDNPSTGIEATLEEGGPGAQDVEGTLEGLTPDTTYHLRLYAENADGSNAAVATSTFETEAVAKPTIDFDPITTFDAESASFAGNVNPNAPESAPVSDPDVETVFATEYRFECTPECPNTPGTQTIPADDGPNAVSFDASSLEPSTEYTVRLFASNRGGEEVAEQSFTTSSLEPTAITHLVANLLSDSARLTGFVDPQNEPTTYFFEWGQAADLSDAQSLPAAEDGDAGSGGEQVAVGEDLASLAPSTTYYYRLVTDNPTGPPSVGEIESFTTRETPPPMGDGVGAFGDRVIELVSDPDLNGNRRASARLSADGNRALYTVAGGTPHGEFGDFPQLLASRTPNGWVSRSARPLRSALLDPSKSVVFMAATPDLSRLLYHTKPPLGEESPVREHFAFSPLSGKVDWMGRQSRPRASNGSVGSDDLNHFFGQAEERIGPADPTDEPHGFGGFYDFAVDPPQLVGLLPNETAPVCGVQQKVEAMEFPINGETRTGEHWVSTDGKRLYFVSRGNGDCSVGQQHLYMREAGPSGSFAADSGASTTLIAPTTPAAPFGPRFLGSSPDGSTAFFWTADAFDPDDSDASPDIYRHVLGAGSTCVTCSVPDVAAYGELPSEDGSHLYFTATKRLAPGALPGRENLYVWRAAEPDQVEFIAPRGASSTNGVPTLVSSDGSTMIFQSGGEGIDALTGNDTSGACSAASAKQVSGSCRPIYRYDEDERSLTCVSCSPGGVAAWVVRDGREMAPEPHTNLSDDGRSYFFTAADPLVATDVNEGTDTYEWREGQVGLITDGVTLDQYDRTGGSPNAVIYGGVSRSGRDILFASPAPLVPGLGETRSIHIYDARIGGGFPTPPAAPSPCAGDLCHGAPTPAPLGDAAGSAQFAGAGNQPAKASCAKGKVKKRGNCVKKKSKQKKRKSVRKHAKNKANANRGGGK